MNFARIIRSSSSVREMFTELPIQQLWWRGVLALHGKPVNIPAGNEEAKKILAKGFHFYGRLYATLGGLLLLLIPATVSLEIPERTFWSLLFGIAGCFLLALSQLATQGAKLYEEKTKQASALLSTFFFGVTGFLCCFAGGTTVVAITMFPQCHLWILFGLSLGIFLGIGSYLIEILFLFFHADTLSDQNSPVEFRE